MPNDTPTHADHYVASLKSMIGQAVDDNEILELRTLKLLALGAHCATGDNRFRELANYACHCALAIPRGRSAMATRH